jgi:hypothetical protein
MTILGIGEVTTFCGAANVFGRPIEGTQGRPRVKEQAALCRMLEQPPVHRKKGGLSRRETTNPVNTNWVTCVMHFVA